METKAKARCERIESWDVSDEFWQRVEPLIPARQRSAERAYLRKPGAGRPPKPPRLVFEAIVYVLRTGCQWRALPKERFGSSSAIHARFLEWERAGVFTAIWQAGLAEYDPMEGIAWRWQSIDGAMVKAPLAQKAVGSNPTDRGESRQQAPSAGRRPWRPVVARRHRSERA
jgi:transposase